MKPSKPAPGARLRATMHTKARARGRWDVYQGGTLSRYEIRETIDPDDEQERFMLLEVDEQRNPRGEAKTMGPKVTRLLDWLADYLARGGAAGQESLL